MSKRFKKYELVCMIVYALECHENHKYFIRALPVFLRISIHLVILRYNDNSSSKVQSVTSTVNGKHFSYNVDLEILL